MSSSSDEESVASEDVPVARTKRADAAALVQVRCINEEEAPLEETPDFKVMVELTGGASGRERPGLDLVTVLDVSESMDDENKLGELTVAMRFLIRKLTRIDRLSVVTFNERAAVPWELRRMDQNSREGVEKLLEELMAGGSTNIAAGLQAGLDVLANRGWMGLGRSAAIMLMSDGGEDRPGDAAGVEVGDVPVYTFGFGGDHRAQVLADIAKNGGTFSEVGEVDGLSRVFAQCLGGLLTVVVQDLKLTVTPAAESTLKEVSGAGSYPQTRDDDEGSVTVSFGNLYSREVRRIIVYLDLPPVDSSRCTEILNVDYAYSYSMNGDEPFVSFNVPVVIHRTGTAEEETETDEDQETVGETGEVDETEETETAEDQETDDETEETGTTVTEVTVEECRVYTAAKMIKARVLAEENNLRDAKKKLRKAETRLNSVRADSQLIVMLKYEVGLMIRFMGSREIYDQKGRSFALSSESSHGLQRFAARGDDADRLRFFATPRMDRYLEQATRFAEDPLEPVPTEEDDLEEELEEDPLAPVAGSVIYYIQKAVHRLQRFAASDVGRAVQLLNDAVDEIRYDSSSRSR